MENLVTSCSDCNLGKKTKKLAERDTLERYKVQSSIDELIAKRDALYSAKRKLEDEALVLACRNIEFGMKIDQNTLYSDQCLREFFGKFGIDFEDIGPVLGIYPILRGKNKMGIYFGDHILNAIRICESSGPEPSNIVGLRSKQ